MGDVTQEQVLAAARFVGGPNVQARTLKAPTGEIHVDASVGSLHGYAHLGIGTHVSGASWAEVLRGLARCYARVCRAEAEPWFAAGGRCVALALRGDLPVGHDLSSNLVRLLRWVDDAETRVYRAAGVEP